MVESTNAVAKQLGTSTVESGDCDGAINAFSDFLATDSSGGAANQITSYADQIESGDEEGGNVSLALPAADGTVTVDGESVKIPQDSAFLVIEAGEAVLPVPVTKVDGGWFLADPAGLLFGSGDGT